MENDPLRRMTEVQFARELGVSPSTVGRLRRAGQIDYHKYGSRVYYLQEDVDAWHRLMKHEAWDSSKLRKVS